MHRPSDDAPFVLPGDGSHPMLPEAAGLYFLSEDQKAQEARLHTLSEGWGSVAEATQVRGDHMVVHTVYCCLDETHMRLCMSQALSLERIVTFISTPPLPPHHHSPPSAPARPPSGPG